MRSITTVTSGKVSPEYCLTLEKPFLSSFISTMTPLPSHLAKAHKKSMSFKQFGHKYFFQFPYLKCIFDPKENISALLEFSFYCFKIQIYARFKKKNPAFNQSVFFCYFRESLKSLKVKDIRVFYNPYANFY